MNKSDLFDTHPLPWAPDSKAPWLLRDANDVVLATFEARDQWGSISSHNEDVCAAAAAGVNSMNGLDVINKLQTLVCGWADTVVPARSVENVAIKLIEESLELIRATRGAGATADELADVFILALDLANLTGTDIDAAVRSKMAINAAREWEVRADGTAQHVG